MVIVFTWLFRHFQASVAPVAGVANPNNRGIQRPGLCVSRCRRQFSGLTATSRYRGGVVLSLGSLLAPALLVFDAIRANTAPYSN